MVFSSILFLFYFFPIVFIVNKLLPKKYKNLWLFFASLFFYAWGEPIYILIMLFSTFFDYTNGRLMVGASDKKKKLILINSIVVNLGILFFFKYSDFFIKVVNEFGFNIKPLNLALPLGISFYTFQTLSYTIDCYRGRVNIADNIVDFGLFVTSFPQLIAGPIVKYIDVENELKERDDSLNSYNVGMRIFIEGLFLKVLLANKFGEIFNSFTFADASSKTLIFLKLVAYSLQIYFDFAGYSKMAIGMGRMLGFHFPENFNYPYISKSITEFWSRWHMTLSSWFKEYVYIPLGGNRVGRARRIFNIFVVWFLTGFWHGADYNFILWGMYFFVVLILEKYFFLKILEKAPKFVSRIYTLIIIMFSWVLFTSTNLKDIGAFFTSLGSKPFFSGEVTSFLLQYGILFVIGILFSTPKPKEMFEKQKEAVQIVVLTIVFILSIAALVAGNYNPFLYFRF
ncbi:MAG: MBOAT family O-acyltransferase [Ezakiella sp.]|uniref:MBOAT family O-acyltransferase n=1 Tax=Ezakiella sp. TaxID=1935205 RepID=UPI002979A497|nr:MBOAT family O-acyltransferase [Ezakiella sp.]MDD7731649.1 MBOAT family protein [Eubacteriales bacterium]MDY6080422.1 MBOAT family O-acyltransferase [Ezakiella sp.]